MSGFIPALKIDKIPLGDGLVIKGEVVVPDAKVLNAFTSALNIFLADWRERASKGQLKMDLSGGLTISNVKLRADKPSLKEKSYSVGIDMTGVSLDDKSKLFNYSQDDSKEYVVTFTAVPKKATKAADEKEKSTDAKPHTISEKEPDTNEPQLVDHSTDKLTLPQFPANSVEERLQVALFIKDADAAKRWAGRIKSGLSDRDIKAALHAEWDGTAYEAPDDGLHFLCMSKGLKNGPAFRISQKPGMKAMITDKPVLQGAQLFKKVREVLGVEEPSKGAKGARTVH